jgi:LmbE family N-acetylglucosaminyl deacetylase
VQLFSNAKIVAVAAHPDDEVVSFGAQLLRNPDITVVHVTDGAPESHPDRDAYRTQRHREAERALAIAGIAKWVRLKLADQQAMRHLHAITEVLLHLVPEDAVVITHPFEGGHPDHDACAFAVAQLRTRMRFTHLEWASYHNDGADQMRTGEFLPSPYAVHTAQLTAAELVSKRAMLAAHSSQEAVLKLFDPAIERYREAPIYDFTARPQPRLLYETFGWAPTWEQWLAAIKPQGSSTLSMV